jgi:hypothetical protein
LAKEASRANKGPLIEKAPHRFFPFLGECVCRTEEHEKYRTKPNGHGQADAFLSLGF